MSSTVPAMKGRMGTVDYYLLSMKAAELVKLVTEPKNMPGWDDEKIEEIYQRKLNYNRVRNQIAPYLSNNKETRFFGSLIVAALNFDDNVIFQPLTKNPAVSVAKLGPEQNEAASKIGMLTLHGGIVMVPLDGQHRLKALAFAMSGKDQKGADIPGIQVDTDLANEDVSVILVPYDSEKARRIFTRVNRYARRPTASETFVTDDDDVFAVLARHIANRIGGRLVKYTQPSLTVRDPHFTTLAILRASCKEIIEHSAPPHKVKVDSLPDEDIVKTYRTLAADVWDRLLGRIDVFRDATSNRSEDGDDGRREIRKTNLLGKPVAQECLVSAYMTLTGAPTNMHWERACRQLNALPWAIASENISTVWQNVLWSGGTDGKILTKNRVMSTRLISYMAGEVLDDEQQQALLDAYRSLFPDDQRSGRSLPPVVDTD